MHLSDGEKKHLIEAIHKPKSFTCSGRKKCSDCNVNRYTLVMGGDMKSNCGRRTVSFLLKQFSLKSLKKISRPNFIITYFIKTNITYNIIIYQNSKVKKEIFSIPEKKNHCDEAIFATELRAFAVSSVFVGEKKQI